MKTGSFLLGFMIFTSTVLAQTVPSFEPRNVSIQTTGGIAYLHFIYDATCGYQVYKTAPSREGTNVHQQVFLGRTHEICPFVFPPPVFSQAVTLVLGSFEPGNYACILTANDAFPSPGTIPSQRTIPFTVGPDGSIRITSRVPSGIGFEVVGTSNVTYRVHSSATLTNWAQLSIHNGAPFSVTNYSASAAFFKVEINDNVPTSP
jgi:hypothetical protein